MNYAEERVAVYCLTPGLVVATAVWMSEKATSEFEYFCKKDKIVGKRISSKLLEYSKAGFEHFEGKKGCPIKHEGDGVYRVGIKSSLIRLIGFYGEGYKKEFIVIDAIKKGGEELRRIDSALFDRVARIKKMGSWIKVDSP